MTLYYSPANLPILASTCSLVCPPTELNLTCIKTEQEGFLQQWPATAKWLLSSLQKFRKYLRQKVGIDNSPLNVSGLKHSRLYVYSVTHFIFCFIVTKRHFISCFFISYWYSHWVPAHYTVPQQNCFPSCWIKEKNPRGNTVLSMLICS